MSNAKYVITTARVQHLGDVTCLVKERTWRGTGNFGGWYSHEFYDNAHVVAYVNPESCEVESSDITFKSLPIFSCMADIDINVTSDEAAFIMFKEHVLSRKSK